MKLTVKNMKSIITMMLMLVILGACANNSKNSDTLVIGYDNTFVPMGFLDENGKTVGFDVDLANEVFNRLDYNIQFQSIDWSMKETELNSGNIDLIWNGYSLTKERKQLVAYTDAYLQNKQIIITKADSSVKSKQDLLTANVGTQQGSASLNAIENEKGFETLKPFLYENFDQAFRDLEIERIDALIVDETYARYYLNQKGLTNYVILDENFGEEDFVVAFRQQDTELRDEVNEMLSELKADGTFDQIYNKWFTK